jgi:hypothetical protein
MKTRLKSTAEIAKSWAASIRSWKRHNGPDVLTLREEMQKLYGHVKITGDNLKLLEWKSASNGEAHFASSEKALKNLEMTLLEILGQDKNHLDLSRRMEKNGLVGKCRIIYTPFANQCSSLAAAVEDRLGIECAAFHRSMSRVWVIGLR